MASWPQVLEQHKITCLWCDVFGNSPDTVSQAWESASNTALNYLLVGTLYHSKFLPCLPLPQHGYYPHRGGQSLMTNYFSGDELKQLHNPTRGFRIDLAVGAGTSAAEPGPCMSQKYHVTQWLSRMGCPESAICPGSQEA